MQTKREDLSDFDDGQIFTARRLGQSILDWKGLGGGGFMVSHGQRGLMREQPNRVLGG